MSKCREAFQFSNADKDMARQQADGTCQFPAEDCSEPNTGQVNHLTGCFIAHKEGLDRKVMTDPFYNAMMLCEDHQEDLDRQEDYQRECIIFLDEKRTLVSHKKLENGKNTSPRKGRSNTRTMLSRRKRRTFPKRRNRGY